MISKAIKLLKQKKFHNKYRGTNVSWDGWGFTECNYEIDKTSSVSIAKDVFFRFNCAVRVRRNAELQIGNCVSFNDGCIITARKRIVIGNNVLFGPHVIIFDHDHDFKSNDFMNVFVEKDIVIEDNVWVGGNVSILKGTVIHEGATIAAGAVVTGEVPPHSVYINKSKIIRYE